MINLRVSSNFSGSLQEWSRYVSYWRWFFVGGLLFLTGCQTTKKIDFDPVVARFYMEMNPSEGYNQPVRLPVSGISLAVHPDPVLSETDLVNVDLVKVDLGLCLSFDLDNSAGRDLYRLTVNNQGRRLVLSLNNAPVGIRMIDQPFSTGNILIFVELPDEDLEELVINLKKTTAEVQKALQKSRR